MHAKGEVSIDKKIDPDWWPNEKGSPILIRIFFLYTCIKIPNRGHHFFEGLNPDNCGGKQLEGQARTDNIFFISYCCFVALEEPSKPLGRIEKIFIYILYAFLRSYFFLFLPSFLYR